jgi:hypothetical protein
MAKTKRRDIDTVEWRKLRKAILIRDGYICWICGGDGADSVDHLEARVHGGATFDRDNLAAAHKVCNSRKGAKKGFFSGSELTPPAFVKSSLPNTRGERPLSPFQKP